MSDHENDSIFGDDDNKDEGNLSNNDQVQQLERSIEVYEARLDEAQNLQKIAEEALVQEKQRASLLEKEVAKLRNRVKSATSGEQGSNSNAKSKDKIRNYFLEQCPHEHKTEGLPKVLKGFLPIFDLRCSIRNMVMASIAATDPEGVWTMPKLSIKIARNECPELSTEAANLAISTILSLCPGKAEILLAESIDWCPETHETWKQPLSAALHVAETMNVALTVDPKNRPSERAVFGPGLACNGIYVKGAEVRRSSSLEDTLEQLKSRAESRKLAKFTVVILPFLPVPKPEDFNLLVNELIRIQTVIQSATSHIAVFPTSALTMNSATTKAFAEWESLFENSINTAGIQASCPSVEIEENYQIGMVQFDGEAVKKDSVIAWWNSVFPQMEASEATTHTFPQKKRPLNDEMGPPPKQFRHLNSRGTALRGRGGKLNVNNRRF